LANDFLQRLGAFDRVLLTTHEQPDPDGVGSMLGLAWRLQALGKEFRLAISSAEPPCFLDFLDPHGWVRCFDPDSFGETVQWADCWALADANELSRLGPLKAGFLASKAAKCCIDHHEPSGDLGVFDFAMTDPRASSTCELVVDALCGADQCADGAGDQNAWRGLPPDAPPGLAPWSAVGSLPLGMAQALYAGMVDDTGWFRFPGTSPKVMRIAAALLERGVAPEAVNRALYGQATPAKLRLEGMALGAMELRCAGRLAVTTVSLGDLKSVGAVHGDIDGLVSRPMELRTVEVSALFYEKLDGSVKASMRSKSSVDVNAVCRLFGGGGHKLASGATLPGPMASAIEATLPAILARIEQDCGTWTH
jgi:phosphoesterase RecJ-like protein